MDPGIRKTGLTQESAEGRERPGDGQPGKQKQNIRNFATWMNATSPLRISEVFFSQPRAGQGEPVVCVVKQRLNIDRSGSIDGAHQEFQIVVVVRFLRFRVAEAVDDVCELHENIPASYSTSITKGMRNIPCFI